MLSTSVYCAIHVTTVLVTVILIWTAGFTKAKGYCRSNPGRETCSSTESLLCRPGQRPQIVEAYFVNATDHNVCGGVNCKATPSADGDFQCLADLRRTGFQCVQRLGYTDLDVVYNTCANLSRNCRGFSSLSDTNLLSLKNTFTVDYLCIPENSTIDPCLTSVKEKRSNASLWLPYSTTSCHSVCEITPVNTQRSVYFKYQLIEGFTKSGQVVRDNNITYNITFTPSTGKRPQWEQFHNSYYDDYQLWQHVDKLRIRFNIPRGDVVRHLWISFNDTEVKIACTANPTAPSDCANNNNIAIDRRTSPNTNNNEEGGFSLNTTNTLIIGMAVGAVLASIATAGVCVVLRKRGKSFVHSQPRRRLERAPSGGLSPSHPGRRGDNLERGSSLHDEIREDLPENSGNVDMSGTTQADEGLDAHSYVNTEDGEASVDTDGYLIARPVVRAHQANDTPAEYIELLP